jgi:cytochrome P450
MALSDFNPLSPETIENPYAFHRAARAEAPVFQVPGAGFFIVSRYADIVDVLNDAQTFSSRMSIPPRPPSQVTEIVARAYPPIDTLVSNDPPSHTRYRALVTKAFSARRMAMLEPKIRQIARELIDQFAPAGKTELVRQFAVGLPLIVIADALGVARADINKFKRWSDDSAAQQGGMISPERLTECAHSLVEFQHYFAARLEERRLAPREDFLSDLINARIEGTRPLTTPEMLSILKQLLVAGNETTTNLIGSAMMLLLQNPDQMRLLLGDPSLTANFIEEALRMESPVQMLFRIATAATRICGVAIPKGALLAVIYAAGNRDEAQFPNPDRFDIRRSNAKTHLAFGQGIHFCIGAALARLEGRIAFEELLPRLKNIRLAEGNDFTHTPNMLLRGLKALHLEFDPT